MIPECIDPEAGGSLREILEKPISEAVHAFQCGCDELWNARLHWNSCPACRHEFAGVPEVFAQIGLALENSFKDELSKYKDEYLGRKCSLLAAADELSSTYPELIAWLVMGYDNVYPNFLLGQQVLGLRVPTVSHEKFVAWYSADEPILSLCREFICSLEPDVQHFVVAATLCDDLLHSIYEKIIGEIGLTYEISSSGVVVHGHDNSRQRFETAIANFELSPEVFFRTIELAAIGYIRSYIDNLEAAYPTTVEPPPGYSLMARDRVVLPNVLQELKQEFDNALDSLKAGQMETIRLIEHNQRPASAYEADIESRLGASLYSRLGETTRLGLQVAEYLYHINSQEPNYFHGPVMQMAIAYENELAVRLIWPFVNELQNAGEEEYDGQGVSREPLLSRGEVPRNCMMLGNLGRYLRKDSYLRSKVSALRFDVGAIADDATWIATLRNKAAHAPVCERAVADDLRQRMLCRGGVFSRLHPMVAIAPSAS